MEEEEEKEGETDDFRDDIEDETNNSNNLKNTLITIQEEDSSVDESIFKEIELNKNPCQFGIIVFYFKFHFILDDKRIVAE